MPGRFSFIIGGARSGKSAFSIELASSLPGRKVYLATAEALDSEMDERIRKHKEARGDGWETIEEGVDLAGRLSAIGGGSTIVIDCLTLWVTNLMTKGLTDTEILDVAKAFSQCCASSLSDVVAVSNEVGLGIVPENRLARRFRDLAGSVNQAVASSADEVWFVASGIPLKMK